MAGIYDELHLSEPSATAENARFGGTASQPGQLTRSAELVNALALALQTAVARLLDLLAHLVRIVVLEPGAARHRSRTIGCTNMALSGRLARVRRRWVVLVALVALVVVGWTLAYYASTPIPYYRVLDEHTIIVGAQTGTGFWAGVTSVAETNASVVVSVHDVRAPLPQTGTKVVEFTLTLRDPLGDRIVVDASDGHHVPRH